MSFCASVFVASVLLASRAAVAQQKDVISFPESFGDDRQRPAGTDEVPLYAPDKCPENEFYYPGDQPGVYICDCIGGYVYLPTDEKCYAAYEQGPCSPGDILILPENKVIPVCVANVCSNEGRVMFTPPRNSRDRLKAGCVTLNKPCDKNTMRVFGVNATTLKLECLNPPQTSMLGNRFAVESEEVKVPVTSAPPAKVTTGGVKTGSRRTPGNRPRVTPERNTEQKPIVSAKIEKSPCYPGCKRSQRGEC